MREATSRSAATSSPRRPRPTAASPASSWCSTPSLSPRRRPEYEPYRTFTQDNFLDARTEAVLPREVLAKQGMTLDQIGRLLALHPVEAEVHHAATAALTSSGRWRGSMSAGRAGR